MEPEPKLYTDDEYTKAEQEVRSLYKQCNGHDPFQEPVDRGWSQINFTPMNPKAVGELFELLHRIHDCYNIQMDGLVQVNPNNLHHAVIVEDMHELVDRALDVVRFTTFEPQEWENEHPDEPRPEWLTD